MTDVHLRAAWRSPSPMHPGGPGSTLMGSPPVRLSLYVSPLCHYFVETSFRGGTAAVVTFWLRWGLLYFVTNPRRSRVEGPGDSPFYPG